MNDENKAGSLWCCPNYPTALAHVDWQALPEYLGFSDHTGNVTAGGLAAAHGATVIEAHVSLLDGGLDGPVNIVGRQKMAEYVEHAQNAEVTA